MAKFIAFYLPQYFPTPENDEWWGPGFTEWRSVAMAKPLFKGHVQPKIPGELGFYDLRVEETRQRQSDLAQEYGIDAFCYWHYWFGGGKRLLNEVFDDVVRKGQPNIPFCLGWANHTWYKKTWTKDKGNTLLMEQKYPGVEDYVQHFNTMLPAFKDARYFKHNGKLIFLIYDPVATPELKEFIDTWRRLAKENGLGGFFFIGKTSYSNDKKKILDLGFDAIYNDNIFGVLHREPKWKKGIRWLKMKLLNLPMVFQYKDAIKYMLTEEEGKEDVCPVIVPNWDHSPRSGVKNALFVNAAPKYFKLLVSQTCELVKDKDNDIVVVKSWNEWGEGNYLEPDIEYGRGMLEALKEGRQK